MVDEVDDEEEEDGGGLDTKAERHVERGDEEAEKDAAELEEDELPIASIDAYWLQRECGRYFNDPLVAQKMAEDVLATLTEADERDCENKLVILLDYDKFDLIKLLLKHRWKVSCCTKLAQAQSEGERAELMRKFQEHPQMSEVLELIQRSRLKTDEIFTETKQLEARVRKETADLARMRKAEAEASVLTADMLAAVPEAGKARVGRNTLDLEAITFAAGGHLMANRKCHLPPGSFRVAKKGYEEVHVPALKAKPFLDQEKLVAIDEIPEWAQSAFGGTNSLNRVQSRVYPCAMFSAENMLICAPTGAGKTNVAMLCMLHGICFLCFDIVADRFRIVWFDMCLLFVCDRVRMSFTRRSDIASLFPLRRCSSRADAFLHEDIAIFESFAICSTRHYFRNGFCIVSCRTLWRCFMIVAASSDPLGPPHETRRREGGQIRNDGFGKAVVGNRSKKQVKKQVNT